MKRSKVPGDPPRRRGLEFPLPGGTANLIAAADSPSLVTALGKHLGLVFVTLRTPEHQAIHPH